MLKNYDFKTTEQEILSFWKDNDIYPKIKRKIMEIKNFTSYKARHILLVGYI